MKRLGLFRHAKSDWNDAKLRDFDRPLNDRGRRGAALMGRHILDYGCRWDRIIASPAVRVAETIEIAAKAAGSSPPVEWDRRIYLASSMSLLDLLREQSGDPDAIMMVGHNPGFEDLIFDLVPDNGTSELRDEVEIKYPTAAFAVMELDIERWKDLEEQTARFIHLMRPRDIDPALGPSPSL